MSDCMFWKIHAREGVKMKGKMLRILVMSVIVGMVLVSFVGIVGNADAKINEDYPVANTASDERNPDIAVAPNGAIYVAYSVPGATDDSIYIKRSRDYGATFEEIGYITVSGDVSPVRIATDSQNNLYLTFGQEDSGSIYLWLWKYDAQTGQGTPKYNRDNGIVINSYPDIAITKIGSTEYIIVTYVIANGPNYDIKTRISTDGGSNFAEKTLYSSISYNTEKKVIRTALTNNGQYPYLAVGYVGYVTSTNCPGVIVGSYQSDAWAILSAQIFTDSTTVGNYVPVAYGGDGRAYAIYATHPDTKYNLVLRTGYGSSWSDPTTVVIEDLDISNFDINASRSNVYLAWEYGSNISYKISTNYGDSFDDKRLLNRDYSGRAQVNPAICSLGNTVYAVWEDISGSTGDIMMRLIPGPGSGSQYHGAAITKIADKDGNPIDFPEFTVTDMCYRDHYLVMVGNHVKDTTTYYDFVALDLYNNRLLLHIKSSTDIYNSVTIVDNTAIIVGKSGSNSAIWTCSLPPGDNDPQSLTNGWVAGYTEFTKVYYAPGKDCFILGALEPNTIISVNKNNYDKTINNIESEEVTAICDVGTNSEYYYIFTFNSQDNNNKIYITTGDLDNYGDPEYIQSPTSNTISGIKINDAAGYPALISEGSSQYYRTYLATDTGIYKLTTEVDHDIVGTEELDVDGDNDADVFHYKSIDYYHGAGKMVAVGGADLDGITGDECGVAVILSNPEGDTPITEFFEVRPHQGGYRAVAMKDDGSMFLGGSYEIIDYDYYGLDTLNLNVQNVPPIARNFRVDYASVPYNDARAHAQLTPDGSNPVAIWIDVTDPNSRDEITEVTLQAWHDGEYGSITWPDSPSDANGVVNITYNVPNDQFTLNYPKTGEVTLGLGSATPVDETTLRIKFVFTPCKQARYGVNGSATSGDDECTWNVRFECNDTTNNITEHGDWEFGYVKVTSLSGVETANAGTIVPGEGWSSYGDTNTLTITWSSNWKYKVSVAMTSSLYHAGPPSDTIPADNVLVYEPHVFTSGYVPNQFSNTDNDPQVDNYYGFDHGNPVYWYGSSTTHANPPTTGYEQSFQTHFRVYVTYGTLAGSYTANLAYVVDIA